MFPSIRSVRRYRQVYVSTDAQTDGGIGRTDRQTDRKAGTARQRSVHHTTHGARRHTHTRRTDGTRHTTPHTLDSMAGRCTAIPHAQTDTQTGRGHFVSEGVGPCSDLKLGGGWPTIKEGPNMPIFHTKCHPLAGSQRERRLAAHRPGQATPTHTARSAPRHKQGSQPIHP